MKAKEYVQQHLGETAEQSVAKLTAALDVEFNDLIKKRRVSTDEGRKRLEREFNDKARAIAELSGQNLPVDFYGSK